MPYREMSGLIKERLHTAATRLGVADPVPLVGQMLDRSFYLPPGSPQYGENVLMPGAVPCEPSFSEQDAGALRFTIEPLTGASPVSRQQEATREMRRLVGPTFGGDALRWFDARSEEWRGAVPNPRATYGAWFGAAFDPHGLAASKVYYELQGNQLAALPLRLRAFAQAALESLPGLAPLFTTIHCGRSSGSQRVTFLHRGILRLADLGPLMSRLGLGHQLPSVMQVVGLALGGRFELPDMSVLLGLRDAEDGPELKLEVVLNMLPDVPSAFLDLLAMALAERPRRQYALTRWLEAFTPESSDAPGHFSVMSVRTTSRLPARVSLYLRPADFELHRRPPGAPRIGVHEYAQH